MKSINFVFQNEIKSGYLSDDNSLVFEVDSESSDTNKTIEFAIDYVQLLTPTKPGKIVCVGRNYAEHAAELGNDLPKEPLLFLKATTSLILENEFIEIPPQSEQVEHEGELGIVIGKNCKNLTDDDNILDFVLGYICLNDVTARDLQRKDIQFTRAKSFDTFCPVSKFIKTDIEVSDLQITTKVNGIIKQEGRTSQMVFQVPFLIKYISNQMTLNFGDIIATGTPSGVSKLNDGDICEVEIESIGKITNSVRKAVQI